MKKTKSGLKVVQNLYLLQVDLHKFLKSDLTDPEERKKAREQMREFSKLLDQADWEYMGGEDIYLDLKKTKEKVESKIGKTPAKKKKK